MDRVILCNFAGRKPDIRFQARQRYNKNPDFKQAPMQLFYAPDLEPPLHTLD